MYTSEHIDFLRDCRERDGLSFNETMRALRGLFGVDVSRASVVSACRRNGIAGQGRQRPMLRASVKISTVAFTGVPAIALVDLEPHHCRFPIGDNPGPTQPYFCGCTKVEGQPYCGEHLALCTGGSLPKFERVDNFRGLNKPAQRVDVRTFEDA